MDRVHFFGIRHLSPNGAWQLLQFLDEIKPTAVLIEGPNDASDLIPYIVNQDTVPPIAILAYTNQIPIKTVMYPYATYSPEYQAMKWAYKNKVFVKFIDLPTSTTLSIDTSQTSEINGDVSEDIYEKWANLAGEDDHETYWERNFEHCFSKDIYRLGTIEYGKSIRLLTKFKHLEEAHNTLREAYMKFQIEETSKKYERIVVVTGAYHTEALKSEECIPLNDKEISGLPKLDSSITLMPYSYLRLSTRSGYGAGNNAPYYFELLWEAISKNDFDYLSYNYLSQVAHYLREDGFIKSSAEVIEAVRLANTLAMLHEGKPTLHDLRDAATVNLGSGEFLNIAQAVARVEVGTKIGSLPLGITRTSIQDDFYRELKRLNLEKYKTNIAYTLDLDLRENRRVKSVESAFLDLRRSFFLHRLNVLGISFVEKVNSKQESATWAESWILQWKEEAEIELVEAVLLGETIELACAYVLKDKLDQAKSVNEAAKIIRLASQCGLMDSMEYAIKILKDLATDSGEFVQFAQAALDISIVISYKDIRQYDIQHFIPLLSQLFLRATLLLLDAASCDFKSSIAVIEGISVLNKISLEHTSDIDEDLWMKKLIELSNSDDKNPKVSGFACAILLERGELLIDDLSKEISRRLSPGIDADLGTGWFEGLSMKNRYVLLSKLELWEQIDNYISSLDYEQFKRALVFLRRAFSNFNVSEKRNISQNLGQIWKCLNTEEYLSNELTKEEENELKELSNFDFGDF